METINLDEFYIYCIIWGHTEVRIHTLDVDKCKTTYETPTTSLLTVDFIKGIPATQGLYTNGVLQVLEQSVIKTKEDKENAFKTIQLIFQVAKQKHYDGIIIPFIPEGSSNVYAQLYNLIRHQSNGLVKLLCFSSPVEHVDLLCHAFHNL